MGRQRKRLDSGIQELIDGNAAKAPKSGKQFSGMLPYGQAGALRAELALLQKAFVKLQFEQVRQKAILEQTVEEKTEAVKAATDRRIDQVEEDLREELAALVEENRRNRVEQAGNERRTSVFPKLVVTSDREPDPADN